MSIAMDVYLFDLEHIELNREFDPFDLMELNCLVERDIARRAQRN